MTRPRLELLSRPAPSGGIALCAPKLGVWSDPPAPGTPVAAGSSAGTLRQLTRRYDLVVPPGVAGVVAGAPPKDRARAVEYGEALLLVAAAAVDALAGSLRDPASASEDGWSIAAPTDGVFYAAPTPGGIPFAPRGTRVQEGQTLGLIEVMKTFNPIAYGGGSLPESAEVIDVLVADGEEVRAGQPLLRVR